MNIRKKLKEMGLELPVASLPLAAYVPAVKTGKLVFTAGQLPMANGAIAKTGKVGAEVTVEEAKELAQLCALNALGALNLVADVDDVARIVRVVGYVNGAPGFINHPAVVNGASELLIALWGDENGKHARSAIGVAELPLNSPVEVELTFELKKK
jgi:enamine deaminase RidA (YjgF/YER057c/UK114 family)